MMAIFISPPPNHVARFYQLDRIRYAKALCPLGKSSALVSVK
jgi:hypothetical protein